jgi:putative colanic acid biosynthesis glycosyltransferase
MKTLLQINVCCNVLSTGKIAEDIGKSAINNGWNSYISYARNCRQSESEIVKIGSKFDVLWHVLETRMFDNHGFASRRATKKLYILIFYKFIKLYMLY